jgi:hypothetical protein
VSAQSLKRHMPHLPVTLFCDANVACPNVDQIIGADPDDSFPGCAAKIRHIAVLFLDRILTCAATLRSSLLSWIHSTWPQPTRRRARSTKLKGYRQLSGIQYRRDLFRRSSDVQAVLSSWGDLFSECLERVAYGVMAYGLEQMFLRLRAAKDEIRPGDLVIFTPVSRDLTRNLIDKDFVCFLYYKNYSRIETSPWWDGSAWQPARMRTTASRAISLLRFCNAISWPGRAVGIMLRWCRTPIGFSAWRMRSPTRTALLSRSYSWSIRTL